MIKAIRTELYKAVWNPTFWLAILIGCGICTINVIENWQSVCNITYVTKKMVESGVLEYPAFDGISLFIKWIAVNGVSLGNRVYYFIWPILAAFPYGWSYSREYRNGAIIQSSSRIGIKKYFIAKYIATFISGGLAVSLPVLLNLLLNALICPSIIPNVINSLVAVFDGQFMSVLFYRCPWIHGLIWCSVDFLLGGAAACLCFVVGARLRHGVMVTLTPFAFLLVLDGIYASVRSATGWNIMLSPLNLACMVTAFPNPEGVVYVVIGLISILSFGVGWWQVVCHEQI